MIGGLLGLMPLETLGVATLGIGAGYLLGSRRLGGLVGIALIPAVGYATHVSRNHAVGLGDAHGVYRAQIVRFEGFSRGAARS